MKGGGLNAPRQLSRERNPKLGNPARTTCRDRPLLGNLRPPPPRRLLTLTPPQRLLAAAAIAAVTGIAAGVALHLASRPGPPSQPLPVPALQGQAVWPARRRPAPPFTLRDQNGRPISLAAQRGHTVLLAFMDPLCKQECPIEGRGLALAEQQLTPAQRPTILIVSVNPKATEAQAKTATRKWDITGDWHWLLGQRAQLAPIWRAYDITVIPTRGDILHSTAVYVIDRHGFERAGVLAPFLPQFVADDLRKLARRAA